MKSEKEITCPAVGVIAPNEPQRHGRPCRDIDRLDLIESIQPLGQSIAKFRAAATPRYQDVVRALSDDSANSASDGKNGGDRCGPAPSKPARDRG